MQKTKEQIIDETVQFYDEHPDQRGLEYSCYGPVCRYITTDGRRCAIGRCFRPNVTDNPIGLLHALEHLDAEYLGHLQLFWFELRTLHDRNEHWNDNGITNAGREYVAKLRDTWCSATEHDSEKEEN